jgi:hypothetical protein
MQERILSGHKCKIARMTNGSHFAKCGYDAGLRSSPHHPVASQSKLGSDSLLCRTADGLIGMTGKK